MSLSLYLFPLKAIIHYLVVYYLAIFTIIISFICFSVWYSTVFVCFSKVFSKAEYANLACYIICLSLEGYIFSPVTYSYLSLFPDENTDIFVASLLIWFNVSSIILSQIVMISSYILSERFFLKRKRLCNVRVASITKKEYGFAVYFL